LEPKALGLAYWFDIPLDGDARTVTVRFTGRRTGVKGKPCRRDTFTVVEQVGCQRPYRHHWPCL